MLKIAFVWWWTWGHVFPVKSLIDYIKDSSEYNWKIQEIFWIWEKESLEYDVFLGLWYNNVYFLSILSWKIRRYLTLSSIFRNIIDIFKVFLWVFQSVYYLKKNKVNIVFSKWWYVSIPVIFAAKILGKKIYIHESDTVAWLSNKICDKFSNCSFSGFPDIFPNWKFVWQILSIDIISSLNNTYINTSVDSDFTNILVSWWSQWSKTIYSALINCLKNNTNNLFRFHIILWTKNKSFQNDFMKFENVVTYDFVTQKEMGDLLSMCDISITRWWATSLAEQKLFWLKLIIIPLPYTWWNHQYYNALYYKKAFNDVIIEQDELLFEKLSNELKLNLWFKKEDFIVNKDVINSSKKKILEEIFS